MKIQQPSIKLKSHLTQEDYEDIKDLMKYCLEEDITLKLELDYKMKSSVKSDNTERINEFMFYDDKTLIGYIGICQFSGEALEVNGLVHPHYRRMGVFNRLFSLVKDEWHKRKIQDMLLLSDHNSFSGIEFIKQTSAQYDNSEYEMFLKKELIKNEFESDVLTFRKATNKDALEIARQNAIYFDMILDATDLISPEEEARRGVDIYIVELGEEVVGKVQIGVDDGIGGIYGLGVLPQYRRKGFGKEIILKAVNKLKEKQVKEIMLQVAVKNKTALNLYKSCGFVEQSKMDYYKLTKSNKIISI
ncbi:GNAT family N-acetyltransferase [Metabacillus litoralis]|uniref:GNAT family N-acetyltransferase n=1 Tax=Metabacillus litoralis TaxID=152268 RepID=A0A5C6W7N7_9BACI|nr:GNAT family N-acetyltransferase [Metabacillus litoralis]TXC91816.1 GNAT family N-acetyltransferase [Metabacillus litoralis]